MLHTATNKQNQTSKPNSSGCWISLPSQLSDTLPTSHEPHLFTIESAAQFTAMLKQCDEFYCFMLNFTHRVAHGGDKVAEVN